MLLTDIMKINGLDIDKTKLVRHPLAKEDVKQCWDMGFLEAYQYSQGKEVFSNCEYILSFIGRQGKTAEFFGCYQIGAVEPRNPKQMPPGYPYAEHFSEDRYYYHLTKCNQFSELIGRLIIDWGGGTRSWCQRARNEKEVLAILPAQGMRTVKDFIGYDETIFTFSELSAIITDPMLYSDWHSVLSAVNAIYLIVDSESGKQYVGSSYGADGLLGRWRCYVETQHGNNKGIIERLIANKNSYQNFCFTILRILPKTITADEAIQIETLYKCKLQSIAFGMNRN